MAGGNRHRGDVAAGFLVGVAAKGLVGVRVGFGGAALLKIFSRSTFHLRLIGCLFLAAGGAGFADLTLADARERIAEDVVAIGGELEILVVFCLPVFQELIDASVEIIKLVLVREVVQTIAIVIDEALDKVIESTFRDGRFCGGRDGLADVVGVWRGLGGSGVAGMRASSAVAFAAVAFLSPAAFLSAAGAFGA